MDSTKGKQPFLKILDSKNKVNLNKYIHKTSIVHNEDNLEHEDARSEKSNLNQSVKHEQEDGFTDGEGKAEKMQIINKKEEEDQEEVKSTLEKKLSRESSQKNDNDTSNIGTLGNSSKKEIQTSKFKEEEIRMGHSSASEEEDEVEDEEEMPSRSISRSRLMEQNTDEILEYYAYLRSKHSLEHPWEDPDFPADANLLGANGDLPAHFRDKDYQIEWVRYEEFEDDPHFFFAESTSNIAYAFTVKRGILKDKYFLGAVMMLFRKREQFMTNLVLDYEHVDENLRAGFCGFTFFVNGEWKNVTVDTMLPLHQQDEIVLSYTMSNKNSAWLCLLQKAYSKVHKHYDVLNDASVKNSLVDLTGGVSKKILIKSQMDDSEKKSLFDEIKRCIAQNYLIGSMRYDSAEENFDDSRSEAGEEDEILPNCIYNILDIREVDGFRLIYLANYWNRGKWSKEFGPEDENWETNKGLKEKLGYEVITDGTFWMKYEDWLGQFNTLYYCRIFPDTWSQFVIPGSWAAMTSGGAPPKNLSQPWMPERPSEDKSNSPNKITTKSTLNQGHLTSKISNMGTSSILSTKDFNMGLKNRKSNTFKLNVLPAVDEGVHEEEGNAINLGVASSLSILKATKKNSVQHRVSHSNSIIANNSVTHTRNSINKVTTTIPNKFNFQLNSTNISEFKNTKMMNSPLNKTNFTSKNLELLRRVVINDTEDRWFLNPQYKIELRPGTKLIISLIQEDERLSKVHYQKCNFMILLTRNKYSRVWDLKEENIIKKAADGSESKFSREKILNIDYYEILRKISTKKKKKLLAKTDKLYLNIVPYLEYNQKYEVEKIGNSRNFKLVHKEGIFWLRLFSSDEIFVSELARPYETSIDYEWSAESAGGARYVRGTKGAIVENPHWPINPQYLVKFENNISMKVILRKTSGRYGEEEKVGMLLTKPDYEDNITQNMKKEKQSLHSVNKNDQILRVVESTNKILASKKIDFSDITKKMSFNSSEWVIESSYSNNFCSSLFMNFNKIDSPIMLIPTLENNEVVFNYRLSIYSNKPVELFSLNNEESKTLISEWKESNAGGCHLSSDEKVRKREDDFSNKKPLTWMDNPKFQICFDAKDRIPEIEFDIILTRSQTIWKKKIANSIVNSMMGIYIFKHEKDKWKDLCMNMDSVDFVPKSEFVYKFRDTKVDPKGYILMPATYGQSIYGPFSMMIKCKHKFTITPFNTKS